MHGYLQIFYMKLHQHKGLQFTPVTFLWFWGQKRGVKNFPLGKEVAV